MLRPGHQQDFLQRRVNMPTQLGHSELVGIDERIKAQSFFSAKVAEARVLDKLREISDAYSRGDMGLGEARNILKDFLKGQGYDPHKNTLSNLASTARLNLILKQNAAMAHSAGEWARMHSPAAMKVFPYVRYHARNDGRTRSDHADLDGKIFHKDDPFLQTHTPPWEFNCRCYLEEITAKEAGKDQDKIQEPTPQDKVNIDSKSGFVFNPEHAFETSDLSSISVVSRQKIISDAAEKVKNGKLDNVGLIVAPAEIGVKPVNLPEIDAVKQGFEAMKDAARQELESVGLDPDNLPDYKQVNETFKKAGKHGKNITSAILDKFPAAPIEVGTLNLRAAEASGLNQVKVMLERGNNYNGITHLWRDHKELFANPEQAIKVLQETLGNENCRVVVSLKKETFSVKKHGKTVKVPICLKRIVLHNPQTNQYCVMVLDDNTLKLVSWHDGPPTYGDNEWSLK